MRLPEGYESVSAPGTEAFVLAGAAAWLEETVRAGRSLHAWAATSADRQSLRGRGDVFSVPAPAHGPDRRARWAVRHYHRGGAFAPILADRYLAVGDSRPRREASASVALRAQGVPTPAVVAGASYRSGGIYRADLVTEFIPGGQDLAEAVSGERDDAEEALLSAGRLIALLASSGATHADLNARNILIVPGDAGVEAHVLDLDRCRIGTSRTRARAARMLRRLERSLGKLERSGAHSLTLASWSALRSGVETSL